MLPCRSTKYEDDGGCLLLGRHIGHQRPKSDIGHPGSERVVSLVGWIPSWWNASVESNAVSRRHHAKDEAEYGQRNGHGEYPAR